MKYRRICGSSNVRNVTGYHRWNLKEEDLPLWSPQTAGELQIHICVAEVVPNLDNYAIQ